jgi:hypothetical protein
MGREDLEKQTIKSIITGRDLHPGEFEYHWQEFVIDRVLKEANDHLLRKIEELLTQIGNDELADKIRNILLDDIYIKYNQGIKEGVSVRNLITKMTVWKRW